MVLPALVGAGVTMGTRAGWPAFVGLAGSLVVLAAVPEPRPAPGPGEWPHVGRREVAELAAALEQLETTVIEDTALAELPVPMHPEHVRWWLEDLARYLDANDMSTEDLHEVLAAMPSWPSPVVAT